MAHESEKLRASPNFVLALAMDGRPYVAKDSEPYSQFWLSERERVLHGLFARRGGCRVGAAIDDYLRLSQAADTPSQRRSLARAIAGMRAAGVLIGAREDTSRYGRDIVAHYLTHRPFPPEIAARIAGDGALGAATRVLDLAGGPGDLAVQLARMGGDVALMELSGAFLRAAAQRAAAAGLRLTTIRDSCNRLVYRDDRFDLVTVAQALHWLDDVMVCRGLVRMLNPGGSFFVVHGSMSVPDSHPLAHLFGAASILGAKPERPFAEEALALQARLRLLFEALDTPEVDRVDLARAAAGAGRIRPARLTLFAQRRPIGAGFARGFLTPSHIAMTGLAPDDFWRDVEDRCAGQPAARLEGRCDWALLHFRRGATAPGLPLAAPETIAYAGPATG